MSQSRIGSLERDKEYYRQRCERLQSDVDQLRPENARLRECVRSAGILDFASLVLIGLGGGLISYATFLPQVTNALANTGLGLLLAGVFLLTLVNVHRMRAAR